MVDKNVPYGTARQLRRVSQQSVTATHLRLAQMVQ